MMFVMVMMMVMSVVCRILNSRLLGTKQQFGIINLGKFLKRSRCIDIVVLGQVECGTWPPAPVRSRRHVRVVFLAFSMRGVRSW